MCFVDLDGVHDGRPRRRLTTIVGYTHEEEVTRARVTVPVSAHPVDSINLKDPRLGVYAQIGELLAQHGVTRGRVRLELTSRERHAGLTVNEYETLLMRHDLAEVLRNPLRFAAEKGRHMWADPRSIPSKTLDYAKIFEGMQKPAFLFDGRNIVDLAKLRAIGFRASGIGK